MPSSYLWLKCLLHISGILWSLGLLTLALVYMLDGLGGHGLVFSMEVGLCLQSEFDFG